MFFYLFIFFCYSVLARETIQSVKFWDKNEFCYVLSSNKKKEHVEKGIDIFNMCIVIIITVWFDNECKNVWYCSKNETSFLRIWWMFNRLSINRWQQQRHKVGGYLWGRWWIDCSFQVSAFRGKYFVDFSLNFSSFDENCQLMESCLVMII